MKALLLTQYNKLEMADLPIPQPAAGEVLIRVEACGICGSDVHGYDGSSGRRIPPIVMGHEAAGVIDSVGPSVTNFKKGDRVTFDSTIYCGQCEFCRKGLVNLCGKREVLGVSTPEFRRAGAFADYVVVPARVLYALPDSVPFAEAAMIEPLSVAAHAVGISDVPKDAAALVVGAGMIGLLTLQVLKAAGCSAVFVSDIDDTRLALARDLGAAAEINAKEKDPSAEIKRLTGGAGVDIAFEAVGNTAAIATAIESVKRGATVTLIGNIAPTVEIPLQAVVSRQLRLQGSAASSGEYPRAIELIASGAVSVKQLITAVAPLEEGARWFGRLHGREANLMKVVLSPKL